MSSILPAFVRNWYHAEAGSESISDFKFEFSDSSEVARDIEAKYGFGGDLLDIFARNKDYQVHKWHHYIPLYDRYFGTFRHRGIRFLEIGVQKGGSLQMWREYFGAEAIIYGIDINPDCMQFDGMAGQVRIGSQIDKPFLDSVVDEMGGVDIVLDDGSHHMDHIHVTLEHLFPRLNFGGIYMVEDLHAAYWKSMGGGYSSRANFFQYVKILVDDMHHWYHTHDQQHPSISNECSAIHIHDSLVVLEKEQVFRPVHSRIK